jgi:Protein of unknown function (DUF3572)
LKKAPTGRDLSTEQRARAESLAVDVLMFLAGDEERLGRFLALSGLAPENLRSASQSPHFLAGLLDYLAGDESLLLAFSANAGIDAAEIMRAHLLLSPVAEE